MAVTALLASPRAAEACSVAPCSIEAAIVPSATTVPASVPHIFFAPSLGAYPISGATVALFRVEGGVQTKVDITTEMSASSILITPVLPLEPDSDYALEGSDLCASTITKGSFHTTAAAPLPASLGTLSAAAPVVDDLKVEAYGLCSTTLRTAQAAVDLTLSADADPWKGALLFTTKVDGQPWEYSPTLYGGPGPAGTMHTIVYASCEPGNPAGKPGLATGTHSVTMEATLPGTTTVISTPPISLTLSCGDAGAGGADGGTGGSGGGDTGGSGGSNTGSGGSGAGDTGTGAEGSTSSGCSVGVGDAGSAWMIAGLFGLAAMGRRRRARRAA